MGRNCSSNIKGAITQKLRDLTFMYMIHCHDWFCITAKYHENISNRTVTNLTKNIKRVSCNSKSMKAKVTILVRDKIHCDDLFCVTVCVQSKVYSSFRVNQNRHEWTDAGLAHRHVCSLNFSVQKGIGINSFP